MGCVKYGFRIEGVDVYGIEELDLSEALKPHKFWCFRVWDVESSLEFTGYRM